MSSKSKPLRYESKKMKVFFSMNQHCIESYVRKRICTKLKKAKCINKLDQGMVPLHLAFCHGASDFKLFQILSFCLDEIDVEYDNKRKLCI